METFWSGLTVALRNKDSTASISKMARTFEPLLHQAIANQLMRVAGYAWTVWGSAWESSFPESHVRAMEASGNKLRVRVFKAPTKKVVMRVIREKTNGLTWGQRLDRWSKLITSKTKLADRVSRAYARGDNVDEIMRSIRPLVQNVTTSARRIARTEGMRVANAMQADIYRQASTDIWGYRRRAVLDDVTRPEHAELDGNEYPKAADGGPPYSLPDEPNCRCTWEPIFTWERN